MPNDTSTLNGSLLEMKDQLIYELGQKGVTASYDSSTGLLGLIGEISNIQTGGGSCYHIEFSEDSYVAVGGTATLEITLQENYAPKSGATVTVTGSDSSLYTCITNNEGIVTVTVSVSSETTFTCNYSNASDTCIVTVSSYLFYDDCAVDNTSNYSVLTLRGSTNPSLTFDSSNSCYILANNGSASGGQSMMAIGSLAGENSYVMSFKTKHYNTTDRGGTGYAYKGSNGMYSIYYMHYTGGSDGGNITINQGGSDSIQSNIGTNHRNEWLTHIATVTNGKVTYSIKDANDNTLYSGSAITPTKAIQSDTKPGITILWWNVSKYYVKDIKVEAL